jgi:hypothetical protein
VRIEQLLLDGSLPRHEHRQFDGRQQQARLAADAALEQLGTVWRERPEQDAPGLSRHRELHRRIIRDAEVLIRSELSQ